MVRVLFFVYLIQQLLALPEPSKYILSFPTNDNPLNIPVVKPIEKNYIITLGDWGANKDSLEDRAVQKQVANIMNSFYESQKAKGMNLLFIAAVGDNFYWSGQDCKEWDSYWRDIYGANLTAPNVPWLAVYGNHDWANSDKYAMCGWNNTKYVDPVTNIPYAADQLNADKGGCNPSNYYLPDFGYYYTINELNFELLVLEETYKYCPHEVGGGHGNDEVWKNCEESGGKSDGKTVGCGYLGKINNASETMLIERAKLNNNNTNILIQQHYPGEGKRLVDLYKANINGDVNDYTVWSIYGHSHSQKCDRTYTKNNETICDAILTGGGGGCCNLEFTTRGIYVIGFDENGQMTQPYDFKDPAISCTYPCGADIDDANKDEMLLDTCCHTNDAKDVDCSAVDLEQCPA